MRSFKTPLPAPDDLAARYPFLALPPTRLRPRNPNLVPLPPRVTGARQPLPLPRLMPVSLRTPPAPRPAAPTGPRGVPVVPAPVPVPDNPYAAPAAAFIDSQVAYGRAMGSLPRLGRPGASSAATTMPYLYQGHDGRFYELTGPGDATWDEIEQAGAAGVERLHRRIGEQPGPPTWRPDAPPVVPYGNAVGGAYRHLETISTPSCGVTREPFHLVDRPLYAPGPRSALPPALNTAYDPRHPTAFDLTNPEFRAPIVPLTPDTLAALYEADKEPDSLARAVSIWPTFAAAAKNHPGIPPSLLAATAIRESDVRDGPQRVKGNGYGIFQNDLRTGGRGITKQQLTTLPMQADVAAGHMESDLETLQRAHLDPGRDQYRALATAYNLGASNKHKPRYGNMTPLDIILHHPDIMDDHTPTTAHSPLRSQKKGDYGKNLTDLARAAFGLPPATGQ